MDLSAEQLARGREALRRAIRTVLNPEIYTLYCSPEVFRSAQRASQIREAWEWTNTEGD
jgi:hypothetical protein